MFFKKLGPHSDTCYYFIFDDKQQVEEKGKEPWLWWELFCMRVLSFLTEQVDSWWGGGRGRGKRAQIFSYPLWQLQLLTWSCSRLKGRRAGFSVFSQEVCKGYRKVLVSCVIIPITTGTTNLSLREQWAVQGKQKPHCKGHLGPGFHRERLLSACGIVFLQWVRRRGRIVGKWRCLWNYSSSEEGRAPKGNWPFEREWKGWGIVSGGGEWWAVVSANVNICPGVMATLASQRKSMGLTGQTKAGTGNLPGQSLVSLPGQAAVLICRKLGAFKVGRHFLLAWAPQ